MKEGWRTILIDMSCIVTGMLLAKFVPKIYFYWVMALGSLLTIVLFIEYVQARKAFYRMLNRSKPTVSERKIIVVREYKVPADKASDHYSDN